MNVSIGPKRLVISDANRVAAAAASQIASAAPIIGTLLVVGGGGAGKSLLLRTIETMHLSFNPSARRRFINAGELLRWPDDEASAVDSDLVCIDDIDLLAQEQTAQQRLLWLIEMVEDIRGGRVAMTSSMSAQDLASTRSVVPRLLSRLYAATSVTLAPPDLDMRAEMILAELELWGGISLNRGLVTFMARNLPSDGHVIAGATKRIALQTQIDGKEPEEGAVAEILAESFNARRRIPVSAIQERSAAHFHIPLREMTSDRRAREVARPRQVSMYLSKQLTPKSLPDIGRLHGGRDHTTVIHAIRTIDALRATDLDLDTSIRILERELTH